MAKLVEDCEISLSKDFKLTVHRLEIYVKSSDGNEVLLNCSTFTKKTGGILLFDEGAFTEMFIPNHIAAILVSFIEAFPGRIKFDNLVEFWNGLKQSHMPI